MGKRFTVALAFLVALAFSASCGVHQTEAPALSGPSELAMSVLPTAIPDSISQDGASQSSITVLVRDSNARPIKGLAIRLEMALNGTVQDFGTLSSRTIVTGSDGKAFAIYTAPPAPPPSVGGSSTFVQIIVRPIGTDAQVSNPSAGPASIPIKVDIRLVPPGVIQAPAGAPTASFNMSPTPVLTGVPVTFDASASTVGAGATSITSYSWTFGDGTAAGTGRTVAHTFTSAATFMVTLTVTNDRGLSASSTLPVTVGSSASSSPTAPTAKFTFSPAAPASGQTVFFNAASSTAGTGHTISSYGWDFGDGSAATGMTPTHAFASNGAFTVTLTVTDETGQVGVTSAAITITSTAAAGTAPTAIFGYSPAAPAVGETIFFNAGSSTAGAGRSIASYAWTFGDGTLGVGVTPTHAYAAAASYSVQLRVTDDIGQSTTSTATLISVGSPPSPTSNFTFSPASPGRNAQVVFDASTSSTSQGQTIVDVAWNYGDGTAVVHCGTLFGNDPSCVNVPATNRVSAHAFATAQSFTVNLVVTDTAGRTGSHSATVTVVLADPVVNITASPGSPVAGDTVNFNSSATTYYAGATPASYTWSFGDGFGSALANPSHAYVAPGSYTVGLSITDSLGRTGTATVSVTVGSGAPTANLVLTKTGGNSIQADGGGSSAVGGASIATYTFVWGDATPNTGPGAAASVPHTYGVAGSYTVRLTVVDSLGRSATTTQLITVP